MTADKKTLKIQELMKQKDKIRNIAIAAHIDHGKTTFSDNLLAGAGMISGELAGKQLMLDFHGDEAERDRKSTRLNSSHIPLSRMPSSA